MGSLQIAGQLHTVNDTVDGVALNFAAVQISAHRAFVNYSEVDGVLPRELSCGNPSALVGVCACAVCAMDEDLVWTRDRAHIK